MSEKIVFEDNLVLYHYYIQKLAIDNISDLSPIMNNTQFEGIDDQGNTFFHRYFISCQGLSISKAKLLQYDNNIINHFNHIKRKRGPNISLKYFQYVELLLTEMFLDDYFFNREKMIEDLNNFKNSNSSYSSSLLDFTANRLNKLSFMSATGSGKTLIMHINILQYLHYQSIAQKNNHCLSINKIILLSPNERLSNQHVKELHLSSIQCVLFSNTKYLVDKNKVIVIDMNKLADETKIKTVSIDSFETNNLVLVDEGHKGLSGNVWYDYRSRLSADGFSFEYSATFKQALKSGKTEKALLNEYCRSILVDYSYKYFYNDGYGKDYKIFNLSEDCNAIQENTYLTGCVLTFFQQYKLYITHIRDCVRYGISKPLLVFVGNRVTTKTSNEETTDVIKILAFLKSFVEDQSKSISYIKAILSSQTGLVNSIGKEIFLYDFRPLESMYSGNSKPEQIYHDILKDVFNSRNDVHQLRLVNLKQIPGELGIRLGENGPLFGIINIGDQDKFISSCKEQLFEVDVDEFSNKSEFDHINDESSSINFLIGSRKFTEGWNSWRVSTICLINFAKSEGSQAIQMFGRGVRLKGLNGSLKRSSALPPKYKPAFPILPLETLNIFGIKAQYMEEFRDFLENEGLPTDELLDQVRIPVCIQEGIIKNKKLKTINVKKGKEFKSISGGFVLKPPNSDLLTKLQKTPIIVDYHSKIQSVESTSAVPFLPNTQDSISIPDTIIDNLDYDYIYENMINHKNSKHFNQMCVDKTLLPDILKVRDIYQLIVPKDYIIIDSPEKSSVLHNYVLYILNTYMDRFYHHSKDLWEKPYLEYVDINQDDSNFFDEYVISFYGQHKLSSLQSIAFNALKQIDFSWISSFDSFNVKKILDAQFVLFKDPQHLYSPLIYMNQNLAGIKSTPVGLNDGEKDFVRYLYGFLENNSDYDDYNFVLLRNRSKSGVGFYEANNFYPDFILWIYTDSVQYITFVDPKGLYYISKNDPKITFYSTIKTIEKEIESPKDTEVHLNSFIFSVSGSKTIEELYELSKDELESMNILFLNDDGIQCISKMLSKILGDD